MNKKIKDKTNHEIFKKWMNEEIDKDFIYEKKISKAHKKDRIKKEKKNDY